MLNFRQLASDFATYIGLPAFIARVGAIFSSGISWVSFRFGSLMRYWFPASENEMEMEERQTAAAEAVKFTSTNQQIILQMTGDKKRIPLLDDAATKASAHDDRAKNDDHLALIQEEDVDTTRVKSLAGDIISLLKEQPVVARSLPYECLYVDTFIERYSGEYNLIGLLESNFRRCFVDEVFERIKLYFAEFREIVKGASWQKQLADAELKKEMAREAGVKKFNDMNDERENRKVRIQAGFDPNGTSDPTVTADVKASVSAIKKL